MTATDLQGPCILWHKRLGRDGYGRRAVASRPELAHRVAYEQAYGPIPGEMTVDHLCFNRACVNVAHLRLLSHLENSRNQRSAYKTHCANGHEYTPENTYIRLPTAQGGRRDCRTCIRDRVARYSERRRALESDRG